MDALEPSGDLLRRPALLQAGRDLSRHGSVPGQLTSLRV
jgi:hypothetical protein